MDAREAAEGAVPVCGLCWGTGGVECENLPPRYRLHQTGTDAGGALHETDHRQHAGMATSGT